MVAMSNTVAWFIVGCLFGFTYMVGFFSYLIYAQIKGK